MRDVMNLTNKSEEVLRKYQSPARKKVKSRKFMFIELGYYIILAIVLLAAVISMNKTKDDVPGYFLGYAGLSVLTKSMQSEIPQGSFIIIKQTEPDELEVGDDITFLYSGHTTVTHRVIDIYEDYMSNDRGFRTMGVDNSGPDRTIVVAEDVIGKVVFHSKALGEFFSFVKSGVFLSILLIALILGLIFSFWRISKGPEFFENIEAGECADVVATEADIVAASKEKRLRGIFSGIKAGAGDKFGFLRDKIRLRRGDSDKSDE